MPYLSSTIRSQWFSFRLKNNDSIKSCLFLDNDATYDNLNNVYFGEREWFNVPMKAYKMYLHFVIMWIFSGLEIDEYQQ